MVGEGHEVMGVELLNQYMAWTKNRSGSREARVLDQVLPQFTF
jgi:hypothetical protein